MKKICCLGQMIKSMICKRKQRNDVKKLPEDIIYEILIRVRIDSLLKLRRVCKLWNSLIKSSAFILNHLKSRSESESGDLILVSSSSISHEIRLSSSEFLFLDFNNIKGEYRKDPAIPISEFRESLISMCGKDYPLNSMNPIGTCNGLICLSVDRALIHRASIRRDSVLVIWNPCVRKYFILPPIQGFLNCFLIKNNEFGYDSVNNDYKVVQIFSRCRFHVFSLLTGSWKNLNFPAGLVPLRTYTTSVVVNGALHWICGESWNGNIKGIVTYNLSTDLFGEMEMPKSLTKGRLRCTCDRVKYKEWFAILSTTRYPYEYDIWVMKEYGLAESWTKILTLGNLNNFVRYPREPICFSKSGRVLFGTRPGEPSGVISTDLEGKQVKVIANDILNLKSITPFVESLVLLDRPNALSY